MYAIFSSQLSAWHFFSCLLFGSVVYIHSTWAYIPWLSRWSVWFASCADDALPCWTILRPFRFASRSIGGVLCFDPKGRVRMPTA